VGGERGTRFLAVAGHDVEHALGQMLLADAGEPQHAERGVLGGLQHQRVAGAQRGRDLERAEHDRRIPRDDGANNADRLAPRVAQHVLAQRDGLALQLAGEAAEVADDVGGTSGLGPGLGADGVAGLLGDDAGELLHAGLDGIGDLLQQAAALARDDAAPAGEGLARGLHGPVDIFCTPARDAGDGLAVAGRLHGDLLTRCRVDPGPVDQHLHVLACSGRGRLAHCHCHSCCILLRSRSPSPAHGVFCTAPGRMTKRCRQPTAGSSASGRQDKRRAVPYVL